MNPSIKKKKVILAYSGGLDTNFCGLYLAKEKGLEVHAVTVDTGGIDSKTRNKNIAIAKKLQFKSYKIIDAKSLFFDKSIKYLIYGNILKNNTYPLSVSAERNIQALIIAEQALKLKADFVAHGSTGAGNDQVRFDILFQCLIPHIKILTPIRDLNLSRREEIKYLYNNNIRLNFKKSEYSINDGLWGKTIGGKETLNSIGYLPKNIWSSVNEKKAPRKIIIEYKKGIPIAINKKKYSTPYKLIEDLDNIASPYGIGRDIHIGDTILGIKGRVAFEAAAPLLIIKSHHLLEKHVLSKWQLYWKEQLANWYGLGIHEGQYMEPAMRDIEHFLESSQEYVTGKVVIHLQSYHYYFSGIISDYDLLNRQIGTYGEKNILWEGSDVKGFTKIAGLQSSLHQYIQKQKKKNGKKN